MAKEVIMPKFGFTQEASQIVQWLVKEGDTVEAGDPLLEVTTDKVNMEVEAPAGGIVGGIRAAAGDTVPVTQVIAYILSPGESLPGDDASPAPTSAGPSPAATAPAELGAGATGHVATATPIATRLAAATGIDAGRVAGTGSGGRVMRKDVEAYLAAHAGQGGKVRATPAARRLGRELGLDLGTISGSGRRGRVQAADVRAIAPPADALAARRVPFSPMRRAIARATQRSIQEAPHVTFETDVDVTAILALVDRANEWMAGSGDKVTLTAALVRAVAWALGRTPSLNSHLGEDELLLWPSANIGIVVALDDGLLVPVVKDAGTKGMGGLSTEIADLSRRAKQGKLRPEELVDGTFTISNLGMFGIDRFTAIIHRPQVGILAVGRTRRVFVPGDDDRPVVRPICTLTLAVDHRAIDGAVAARFLADLRDVVENPDLLVI
ncbi:MAG: 2-oxo acid dehydrogenase subunit E2 [Anaerolineales bacterium]|nr:2-oxo acid dehydrogenase subunit E2 [Anaerolineales bacterium]